MNFYRSATDSMSLLHDITTQAAGTQSSNYFSFQGDGDEPASTMITYDDDDFSSFGTLSTSASLTSLSSSSSDEIPTRPSSGQGWSFDGAWSIGDPIYTPKSQNQMPPGVHVNDSYGDPAERDLIDRPFLIAQYVAGQLRASMEEDFTPWTPEMQTPTMTPKVSTPTLKGPAMRQYEDLIKVLKQSPYVPQRHPRFQTPNPSLPTIMITAPSYEQATPNVADAETSDLLTLQYSPRPREWMEQYLSPQIGRGEVAGDDDSDNVSQYDDDDVVLSRVKRSLQEARRPKLGLKGRTVGFFKMRR